MTEIQTYFCRNEDRSRIESSSSVHFQMSRDSSSRFRLVISSCDLTTVSPPTLALIHGQSTLTIFKFVQIFMSHSHAAPSAKLYHNHESRRYSSSGTSVLRVRVEIGPCFATSNTSPALEFTIATSASDEIQAYF